MGREQPHTWTFLLDTHTPSTARQLPKRLYPPHPRPRIWPCPLPCPPYLVPALQRPLPLLEQVAFLPLRHDNFCTPLTPRLFHHLPQLRSLQSRTKEGWGSGWLEPFRPSESQPDACFRPSDLLGSAGLCRLSALCQRGRTPLLEVHGEGSGHSLLRMKNRVEGEGCHLVLRGPLKQEKNLISTDLLSPPPPASPAPWGKSLPTHLLTCPASPESVPTPPRVGLPAYTLSHYSHWGLVH